MRGHPERTGSRYGVRDIVGPFQRAFSKAKAIGFLTPGGSLRRGICPSSRPSLSILVMLVVGESQDVFRHELGKCLMVLPTRGDGIICQNIYCNLLMIVSAKDYLLKIEDNLSWDSENPLRDMLRVNNFSCVSVAVILNTEPVRITETADLSNLNGTRHPLGKQVRKANPGPGGLSST